jgi:hypothetical protein
MGQNVKIKIREKRGIKIGRKGEIKVFKLTHGKRVSCFFSSIYYLKN